MKEWIIIKNPNKNTHPNEPFIAIEVPKLIERHIKPLTQQEYDLLKEVLL